MFKCAINKAPEIQKINNTVFFYVTGYIRLKMFIFLLFWSREVKKSETLFPKFTVIIFDKVKASYLKFYRFRHYTF